MRYYDFLRNEPDLIKATKKILQKHAGVILWDKMKRNQLTDTSKNKSNDVPFSCESEKFDIPAKVDHENAFKMITIKPELPDFIDELPSLDEIIDRKDSTKKYDKLRLKLLKWFLSLDDNFAIQNVDKKYRLIILLLTFLCKEKFISIHEADLILLSNKKVEDGESDSYKIPKKLNPDGFKVSQLFVRFMHDVIKSMELSGLKSKMVR